MIGIKITPTAALQPAALGIAMLTIKVARVAPGMSKKPIFLKTLPIATTKCLSQPVYFMHQAKPMQEQTEVIKPALVILLAKASSAAIGLPPKQHIKIPAAIKTILDSWRFKSNQITPRTIATPNIIIINISLQVKFCYTIIK
jgi:hypothetical protein